GGAGWGPPPPRHPPGEPPAEPQRASPPPHPPPPPHARRAPAPPPPPRLAAAAGLRTDRGILVDAQGRTSDPAIFAAGDCVRFDHSLYGEAMRIESVNNALDQARWVAAGIAGEPAPTATIPWFWSDQFDLKIQLAGIPSPLDRLEAIPGEEGFVRHYTRDGVLRAVEAVNAPRAFMLARRRMEAELTALQTLKGAA
ncbi:MAG: oxidoreductase C-terminal domain-containing protein, partial [Devosia sp.]|nr:oxidoreductase C-terminal domain-containing protein [Devosia sp.]